MTGHPNGEDGYTGVATLLVGGEEFSVDVDLRGHFQPIDGRYRWYGRIRRHEQLSALLGGKRHDAVLRTAEGQASGQLSDPDLWDRYRITGTSRPPFAIATSLTEIDGPS